MADINLSGLNIDQLTELVGKAQSEVASRERKRPAADDALAAGAEGFLDLDDPFAFLGDASTRSSGS